MQAMKREQAAAKDAKQGKANASKEDSWGVTFDLDSQSLYTSRVRIAASKTGFTSTITYDQGCKQKNGADELIDLSQDENDVDSVSLGLQAPRKRTHEMLGEDFTTLHFSCRRCSTKAPRHWPRTDPEFVKWKW
jgi:hypothetical protein